MTILVAKSNIGKSGLSGENNPMYGKRHSEGHKLYLSSINQGGLNANSKAVVCIETGKQYSCIKEAIIDIGLSLSSANRISKCCLGLVNKVGGYTWEYLLKELRTDL